MQLSHYIKAYGYEDKPGHLLLFSTKNASKILIKEETFRSMEKGDLSPSDESLLSKLGMVVADREAEKRAMLGLLDNLNQKSTGLNIMVVLNLDCNFSCIYCYEGDIKGKLYMSERTADHLIAFIKKIFGGDKKTLLLDFYGGEPLLSIGLIKRISRTLKRFAESKGAEYGFTLVTNGSLFKRQVAEELTSLGLTGVKITLDGPADIHDRCRPFKSGKGSFDIIIRNIMECCDFVKIGIGGNFDRETSDRFPLLLDYLLDIGLTPEKIATLKFDPIMKQPEGDSFPIDYKGGCMSIDEPWILNTWAFLRKEILKRGYGTPGIKPMSCMVEMKDSYVVNFDGTIYKCPAFIGKKGFDTGTLNTGVKDYTSSYKLGMWKNDTCVECVYLPLCFGGCRYMTLVRDGNINALDCRKAYLDACLETLIKQDIRYGLKAQAN